ncbi:sensor histidine kinase [Nocardioides solisilvae]|uniref:sensor histidine kinase n=1 Tax=Nocardioides solisilvae TaxID=1542435 RepID=UPI000D746BDB|nr:sensor histidine kinase [Nocardioides solisilvae]
MSAPTPAAAGVPWQLGPRGRRVFDRLLVVGLLLPVVAILVSGADPWWTVLGFAQIVPLWWRRSRPVEVFVAVAAASALQAVVIDSPLWSQLAFPVATYSVARHASFRWGLGALGTGLAGAVVASVDWVQAFAVDQVDVATQVVPYVMTIGAIVVTAWALGTVGRTREAHVATLVDRAEQAERVAQREVELAAQDERARIAREMHDVVAHGLTVIVVQADGARYAAAQDPAVAVEALGTIGTTGRESLQEMRRMLGLLRTTDTGVRPQPTLADLRHLVEEARAVGTDVEARIPEPVPQVPDGVGLTAYRVVQEALTNVRKHAGPGVRVRLLVRVGPELVVDVHDDGRGAAAFAATRGGADGRGLGLVGMRERVAAHGGTLEVGPAAGGGFGVRARIPL